VAGFITVLTTDVRPSRSSASSETVGERTSPSRLGCFLGLFFFVVRLRLTLVFFALVLFAFRFLAMRLPPSLFQPSYNYTISRFPAACDQQTAQPRLAPNKTAAISDGGGSLIIYRSRLLLPRVLPREISRF